MYQLGLFIILFATLFTENALADRGDNTTHDRSESSYDHPRPHPFAEQYQWKEYGFSDFGWKGFNFDERDYDNDSNTNSYNNDNTDKNKDLLQNEPE